MRNSILILIFVCSIFTTFSQTVNIQLQPEVVADKYRAVFTIENNSTSSFAPAFSTLEATVDPLFVDFSSRSLVYSNPRWSSAPNYNSIALDSVSSPSGDVFSLTIEASGASYNGVTVPLLTENLVVGEYDTIAIVEFDLVDQCSSSIIAYEIISQNLIKWYSLPAGPGPADDISANVIISAPSTLNYNFTIPSTVLNSDVTSFCSGASDVNLELNGFVSPEANNYTIDFQHWDGATTSSLQAIIGDTTLTTSLIGVGDSVFAVLTDVSTSCSDTSNSISFTGGSILPTVIINDESNNQVSGTLGQNCLGHDRLTAEAVGGPLPVFGQWLYADNEISGETGVTLSGVNRSGAYRYAYSDDGTCWDTTEAYRLQIWPTPRDSINVDKTLLCGIDSAELVTYPIEAGALILDGIGDNMNAGSSFSFGMPSASSFSIEAVVVREAPGSNSGILEFVDGANVGYRLFVNASDELVLSVGSGGAMQSFVSTNSTIPDGFERHVAVVISRVDSSVSFYIDGTLRDKITNTKLTEDFNPVNANLLIGDGFSGSIDEVRLWNVAISLENINTLKSIPLNDANGQLPYFLVGYWHMDDLSNTAPGATPFLTGDASVDLGEGFFKPGGLLYTWNGPSGFFSANNDTVITTLPGNYRVTIDNTVCTNTSETLNIDGVVINTGLPSDTTLCQDEDLVLEGPSGLGFDYSWNHNGIGLGTNSSGRIYTYDPDASETNVEIYVTVSRATDCPVNDTVLVSYINNIAFIDTANGFASADTAFMSWDNVDGATEYFYKAYRTIDGAPAGVHTSLGTDTSFQFNKTNPGIEEWTFELVGEGTCGRDTVFSRISIGTCVNFPYTTINDSAFTSVLTDSMISFQWNASGLATFYDVQVIVNNVITQPWFNNGSGRQYTVNGLSFGDSVCFNYRARTSCDSAEAVERCVVAFNCQADFTGLRDTTQHYCTSSFKDLIEPDSVNNILGSYHFEGSGVLYGDTVWYFDPQDAGFGLHDITMVGCYGADTVVKPVVVLPSPCTEVVGGTDINIPFKNPQGIYTDCDGQIYFTDPTENVVIKIDTFGVGKVIAGVGSGTFGFYDGHIDSALFNSASAIIVHPTTGDVYFTDNGNNAIRKLDVATEVITTLAGGGNSLGTGSPGTAGDSDVPSDADGLTNEIFNVPFGIAFNGAFDTIYVSDLGNHKIKALSLITNEVITIAGNTQGNLDGPFLTGQLSEPAQIKFDPSTNRLYVGSITLPSANIRYLDFNTQQITSIATGGPNFISNNAPLASSFHTTLIDVAADGQGNFFMLDKDMCALKVYRAASDSVFTIVGTDDGEFAQCREESVSEKLSGTIRLNKPTALSVYVNGFVDLVDTDNERVLRVAIDDFINSPNKSLDSTYCANDLIDTLNSNSVAGFYTSVPAGFVSDNGTHWVFNPQADTGFVTVYFQHTIGACQGAEERTVYISPLPDATLGNDTLYCENYFGLDSVQVEEGYSSYQWSFKSNDSLNFFTDIKDSLFHTTVDSAGDYAVEVYNEYGCYSTDTINVTQRPDIDLTFTSTNGDTLCYGEATRLSVDNSNPADPAIAFFTWNTEDTTQIITANLTRNYIVEIEDVLGCTSADTFNLLVKNKPFAFIQVDTTLKNQSNNAFYGEYTSEVFAGRGTSGTVDGVSTSATFDRPWDVYYFDDTLYVSERQFVREIAITDTNVTTIAGGGTANVMDDSLTIFDAQFNSLRGIVVDTNNRIIIVDDNGLKRIENDSLFIFAGDVTDPFYIEGASSIARFDDIKDIDIDNYGRIYVTDYNNHRIRVIDHDGFVSTLVGNGVNVEVDGIGTSAQLNWPYGITFDNEGKMFIIEEGAQKIAFSDLDSNVMHAVGLGSAGFNSSIVGGIIENVNAEFNNPWNGVTDDQGVLYFTEGINSSVRALLPTDSVLTILGSGSGNTIGIASVSQLNTPNGITIDPNTGVLYVADTRNHQIKSLTKNKEVTVCSGTVVDLDGTSSAADDYQWYYKRVLIPGATSSVVSAADSGWYTLRVEKDGCYNFDSVYVGYYASLIANIDTASRTTGGPTSLTICPTDTVTLIGNEVNSLYTYLWEDISNNPLGTDTLLNVSDAGIYYLDITTDNGCTLRDTIVINEFTGSIDLGNDTTTCRGVAFTFDAGAGFVDYQWQDNSIIQTFTSDTAGTFGVTVESTDGCFFTDSVDLAIIIPDSIDITPDSASICFGDSITLTTTILGSSTGTYLWDTGETLDSNTVNSAGYSVVQYTDDVTGCVSFDSILVSTIAPPTFASLVSDSIFCYTDTVYLVGTTTILGDSIFLYSEDLFGTRTLLIADEDSISWNGVDSADVAQYIYVVDNGVCTLDSSITVEPTDVIASIVSGSDTLCFGDSISLDGISSTGSNLPLTYKWTESISNLGVLSDTLGSLVYGTPTNGGTLNEYQLEVIDNLGCSSYDTVQVYLNEEITAVIGEVSGADQDTVAICGDGTDQFTDLFLVVNGGLPKNGLTAEDDYDYFWFVDPSDGTKIGINGQGTTSPTIQSRVPVPDTITVYVNITDSLGCVNVDSVVLKLRVIDIALTVEHDTICPGLQDSISVEVLSGGSGLYRYQWFETFPTILVPTIDNDTIGATFLVPTESKSYTVRVTDLNVGCPVESSVELFVTPIVAQVNSSGIICDGDTATVDASSSFGAVPYTNIGTSWPYSHKYDWSNLGADPTTIVGVDSADIIQITGGTPGTFSAYQLIVSDSIGCADTVAVPLQWNESIVSSTLDDTLYVCNDLTDTLRAVTATGGVSNDNFRYDWVKLSGNVQLPDNGGLQADSLQNSPVFFIPNLTSSDTSLVQLTVTDTIGCVTIDSSYVINNNLEFITVPTYDTICADVSNQITVEFLRDSNATGDYTYNWYDAADVGFLFVDSVGTTQTNNVREPWAITSITRTFELELTDNVSGCVDTASSLVFIFNINPVIGLEPWINDDTTVACFGDDVILTSDSSSGGTPFDPPASKYMYNWFKSSTTLGENSLPLSVVDDSTVTITSNASESNYSIWVLELTDNAGCTRSDSTTIYWNEPIVPILENDTVFVCTPDTSYLKLDLGLTTGGISPYSVAWNKITSPGGSANLLTSTGDSVNVVSQDNDTTYFEVVVTDTAGCIGIDTVVVIGVNFDIDVLVTSTEVCAGFNDTLSVQLIGDFGIAQSYAWSPNEELDDSTLASPIAQPTIDRTYSVFVYDSLYGCSAEDSVSISIVDLTAIAGGMAGLDTVVACFETDTVVLDGSLSFGGVPLLGGGYIYSWSTLGSAEVSTSGSTTSSSLTVVEQATLPIDTTVLQLIVEDLFGCIDTDYVAVYWNSEIQSQIADSVIYSCSNSAAIAKSDLPAGGTPGYSYSWSVLTGSATTTGSLITDSLMLSIVDNDISTFMLEITDTLSCTNTDTAEIRGVDFQVGATAQFNTICSGLNDTLYTQIINDGIGAYSYSWTPITDINNATLATPVVNPQIPTLYTVTVVDSTTLCTASASIQVDTVFLNAVAGPTAGIDTLLRCFGDVLPVSLDASLTNRGTAPYSYTWSSVDGSVNFPISNLNPGEIDRTLAGDGTTSLVYLDVIDDIGCTARDSVYVLWNSEIVVGVNYDTIKVSIFDVAPVCVGIPKLTDGLVSGGSGDYSYLWEVITSTPTNDISILSGTETAQDASIGATTSGANGSVRFTVTDQSTSSGVCQSSTDITVGAYEINVDLEINFDTVCPGTEVVVNATDSDGEGVNPVFSFDDNFSYSLIDTAAFNPLQDSIIIVEVIDDTTGCIARDSVRVTIIDLIASYSIPSPYSDALCYIDSTLLKGTAVGGYPGGDIVYEWFEGVSSISTVDSIFTQPLIIGSTTYRLEVTDSLGCQDDTSVVITRNDSIIANAGIDQILCSNNSLSIGGSPSGEYFNLGGGNFDYTWTGLDLISSSSANPTFDPQVDELTVDTVYTFSVIVKDASLDCFAYDTVEIDVRALPRADFATSNAFVCADESKTLYAYGIDTTYVYPDKTTFEWSQIDVIPNTTLPFTADSAIITVGGEYQVIVTDSNLCVNSTSVNLNQVEQPTINIQSSFSQVLCGNQPLDLTMINIVPAPTATDTLEWGIIQGMGYIEDELSPSTFYISDVLDDTLEIKVDFINKCATGSDTIRLSVVEPPVASFVVTDSTVNVTETVVFSNNSFSPQGNVLSYRWDFNAPNISSSFDFNPSDITYLDEGNFDAQLTVLDNSTLCTDTMIITMYVNGTHLLYIPNVFSPNATNDENRTLKMYGYGLIEDDFIFSVYNRWGEKVYEQTSFSDAINIGWTGEYNNTGEPLDMGVYTYIVRAKYLDGTSVEKVGTITLLR